MSKEKEALAEQPAQQTHCNDCGGFDPECPLAQPAQQQEPVAKVVSTAPKRIWLDLGFDPEVEDEVSFDDLFDATWSHDNATGNGIEYVRADLTPASKPWVGLTPDDHIELARAVAVNKHQIRAIEAKLRKKNA